eukprot:TRINITY_DN540_c0_g2_i1.p1 TRINITY_DN540_c0_g2~~TRINITY_DN540_c0_g2_i1.p1  ORF type:complete len:448 (+),score=99.14 TRINITY_DN540_c0_g2_i1:123-1466(+)
MGSDKAEDRGSPAAPGSVLVYSHSWLPGQVDGVAVRIMAHVRALVDRGVKVTVATPDFVVDGDKAGAPALTAIPGVEHITLQTQRTPVYRKNLCMSFSMKNFFDLIALIKRTKPDIVHGTQEASMQVLAAACLVCDVPLTISMHTDVAQIAAVDQGFSTLGGFIGRIHARISVMMVHWGYRNWALSGATYFCVSDQARTCLRNAGVSQERVAPVAWGPMVDRNTFRIDLPKDEVEEARKRLTFGIANAYLIVYVGRVTAEKDCQFLVDALARGPENLVLALIGPGSLANELAKRHGKDQRLYCTGKMVSREEVALSLRAADACVSASTMETVGFTAMEALSCGTPMLAANAQGFAEHLSHGVNARLWTPNDEASFDKELATLMATPRKDTWAPEALRASMASADIGACTDRALRAYESSSTASQRMLRLLVTVFYLLLNYVFGKIFN